MHEQMTTAHLIPHRKADGSGGDADYGTIGVVYKDHRAADPRIAAFVHAALGDARSVLNVGAGTGSVGRRYDVAPRSNSSRPSASTPFNVTPRQRNGVASGGKATRQGSAKPGAGAHACNPSDSHLHQLQKTRARTSMLRRGGAVGNEVGSANARQPG